MMSTTPTSLSSLSLLLLLGASTGLVSATPFYKMDPSRPWRKEIEVDMTRRQTTGTTAGSDACTAIAGLTCESHGSLSSSEELKLKSKLTFDFSGNSRLAR